MPRDRDGRSGKPDPRIEGDVDHVDQDIEEQHGRAHREHHRLDQRHILVDDRLDGEPADAGVGEDRFRDDGAPEQVAELQRRQIV